MLGLGRCPRPFRLHLFTLSFVPRSALPGLPPLQQWSFRGTIRRPLAFHTRSSMSAPEFCDVCQCSVPVGGWDSHIRGKAHCRKAGLRTEAVLLSANRDRNGVSVSSQETGLDFGVVEPGRVSRVSRSFILKATTATADFMVLQPRWTSSSLSVHTESAYVNP